ncbi:MAG TPA: CAP domain-containing protein [Thermomicrobiales bacterium]|nr:CAP domain-containing protein [Thermomicrobiales bacterium]
MRHTARASLLVTLCSLVLLLAGAFVAAPRVAAAPQVTTYATGHTVAAPFQDYFAQNGGVALFGMPLTDAITENGRTVQYFERQRMEWHPEFAGTADEIELGLLGREVTAGRAFPTAVAPTSADTGLYFDQTHHNLGGAFANFWLGHDGLRLFGYPLSEELRERSADDGQTYTVQYFERARFEWHPATGTVELGRLGDQVFVQTYAARTPQPAALPQAPAGPALDGYERQVLTTLMDARRAAGVPAPRLDSTLVGLARQRSTDMATRDYFSHYTPEGATIFTLLNASGTPWSYAGETIARNNYPSAQSAGVAAQAFLNSPPHRAVILDPQYNEVGIGDAVDAHGMHYYTVVFVRR